MSDEPNKPGQRPFPWAAAVLVIATALSYCGAIAFILTSDYGRTPLLFLWVLSTAVVFRLGMRALKRRHEKALPR